MYLGTTVKLEMVEIKNGVHLFMVLASSSKRRLEFARVLHAIRKSHWLRFLEDQGSDRNKYTGI